MLPRGFRNRMFEGMSNKTMRKHFSAITKKDARGLALEVLEQSEQDFFINGTITCHAVCPELMAGMWSGGREASLVDDRLPAWLKKAMGAELSRHNQCPYCGDMLVSLTHGAKQHNVAAAIRDGAIDRVEDATVRAIMEWVGACVDGGSPGLSSPPFDPEQLPEAIGTVLVFSYTNKITDLTMYGSPVGATGKNLSLRAFGVELRESARLQLEPGRSLGLLPAASAPPDLHWAKSNPRVCDALARWIAVVDRAADDVLSPRVRTFLDERIRAWRGGQMPISRSWVEEEIADLTGAERDQARLALLVIKASYQIDDEVIDAVLAHEASDADVITLGAWAALSAARRLATWTAEAASSPSPTRGTAGAQSQAS
jgi:hypothetical protein